MQALNTLEIQLLKKLVAKYPTLASHIAHLRISKRQLSGFSLYVHFIYEDFAEETEMINALFSGGEKIAIPQLKEGLSYVIDVTAGLIEHIEFSTYKESWNGEINDHQILESQKHE